MDTNEDEEEEMEEEEEEWYDEEMEEEVENLRMQMRPATRDPPSACWEAIVGAWQLPILF